MKAKTRTAGLSDECESASNVYGSGDGQEEENLAKSPTRRVTMQKDADQPRMRSGSKAMAAEEPAAEPETTDEPTKSVQCVSTSNCGEGLVCMNGVCTKPSAEGDPCREPGRIYGESDKLLVCSFREQRLRRVLTQQEAAKVIKAVVLRNVIISIERGYNSLLQAIQNLDDNYYADLVRTGMEAISMKISGVENLSSAFLHMALYPNIREEVASSAVEAMLAMKGPADPKTQINASERPGIAELVRDFKVSADDFTNMARVLYHKMGLKDETATYAMNIVLLDICHTQCSERLEILIAELGDDFKAVFPYVALNPRRCIEKHAMKRFSILYGEYCFADQTCSSCESCFGMGVCRPRVALDCACSVEEQNCADGLVCVDGICRKRCIPGVYGCDEKQECIGSDTDGDIPFHCIVPSTTTQSTTSDPETTPAAATADTDSTASQATTDVYYTQDGEAATSELDSPFMSYDTAPPPEEVESTDPTMSAYWSIFFICLVTVMAIVITILAVKIHRLRVAFKKQRKSLMSSSPNSDGQSMLDNNVQGMDYASTNRDTFDLTPGNNPSNVRV